MARSKKSLASLIISAIANIGVLYSSWEYEIPFKFWVSWLILGGVNGLISLATLSKNNF